MGSISNISEADANLLKAAVGYTQKNLSMHNYRPAQNPRYINLSFEPSFRYEPCYHFNGAYFAAHILDHAISTPIHVHGHNGWGGHGLSVRGGDCCGGGGCSGCNCKGEKGGEAVLFALLIAAVVAVASSALIVAGVAIGLGVNADGERPNIAEGTKITDRIRRDTNREVAQDVKNLVRKAKALNYSEYAAKISYAVSTGVVALGLGIATATIAIAGLAALNKIGAPSYNLWFLGAPALIFTVGGLLALCITPCVHSSARQHKGEDMQELDRLKFELIRKYKEHVFNREFLVESQIVKEVSS